MTPDGLHSQAYYLDLRNGFAFYGEISNPIRGGDRAEPPTVVKEIRAHPMADGTAELSSFTADDDR